MVLAFIVDRVIGDPHSSFHPVAAIGRFIGLWGRSSLYPEKLQRIMGIVGWIFTVFIFVLPFALFSWLSPWFLLILVGPFLLKVCFAVRSLEEHALAVMNAFESDGRAEVSMLVSRDVNELERPLVLSAAFESVSENLNDSIIAPLFYYSLLGLPGAALFRACNTMDAMLGYKDERIRLGWFAARADDVLAYIPARICGLLLIIRYAFNGRLTPALMVFKKDRKKRPGFNGGIPMSLIAGGEGVQFEKSGVYLIGIPERSLMDAGYDILRTIRIVTLIYILLSSIILILIAVMFAIFC